jgi:hypothetical protein
MTHQSAAYSAKDKAELKHNNLVDESIYEHSQIFDDDDADEVDAGKASNDLLKHSLTFDDKNLPEKATLRSLTLTDND